jgi:N-acetylmuramic acid 6-phosphate etherase
MPAEEIVRLMHDEDARAVEAVGEVLDAVGAAAEQAARSLEAGGRLIYVGAGTSGRLGALDAAECPPTFGTHPAQVVAVVAGGRRALAQSVEGAEDDGVAGRRAMRRLGLGPLDFVVGISASGTTPFVIEALKSARRDGSSTALVCCNPAAVPRTAADTLIAPDTGAEVVAGSTRLKAGTATKLVLNAISTAAMVRMGRVYRGLMVDLRPVSTKLVDRAERVVAEACAVSRTRARTLLARAGRRPALAIAMHLTKRTAPEASEALARAGSLAALERTRS